MPTRTLHILMNGVTGRMGTNQHLLRSIVPILKAGGLRLANGDTLLPVPILAGRNEPKLRELAAHGTPILGKPFDITTDVHHALAHGPCDILFDASTTLARPAIIEAAAQARKPVYCEKPTATTLADALRLVHLCDAAGIKHGVVQDKLFLPGIRKLAKLRDSGFFGQILSVRGNFGYWVFTGDDPAQPPQRPSWNYREEDGGGILVDMFCHWRYVIDHTFGPVAGLFALAATDIPRRFDEHKQPYAATADDAAYAIFRTAAGVVCQFNSSWTTRVRRDDLLTIQVDGTHGSAVAGLRDCRVQSIKDTPRPTWNPDIPQPIDFYQGWELFEPEVAYDNAFKVQWEMFLRHVAEDAPWPYGLLEGAKGVQLAELGHAASRSGQWQTVAAL